MLRSFRFHHSDELGQEVRDVFLEQGYLDPVAFGFFETAPLGQGLGVAPIGTHIFQYLDQ